eukprot:TRINITY_DN26146_c0_g1_i13.p1 TRINITY_DN26146_c0_g1~~TRINITY_DN26146_c0_g1_i13.p1  ORF type:complete len:408 (-),score=12.07 TRINITY_DN26146_c0_g1_i13:7-1098(-)
MDKTNIIVFRKGGYLASRERWFYGNSNIYVVNAYKYLGIYFSTKLSFTFTCQDLVNRGKRAVMSIFSVLYRFENESVDLFFKLFDAQIQPIVQYGAEIWGFEKGHEIEKLHLFAMKRFLHVNRRTPNDLVYGELGRYPIYVNSYMKCIKYWLKLVRMSDNRLPAKAYRLLYDLDMRGKITWASYVRKCLYSYGFAFVWIDQGVGCINSFLSCFKQRIIDCRWQDWDNHMQNSERFSLFRMLKTNHLVKVEPYLALNMNKFIRYTLTKFRFGVSDIAVHRQRYVQRVGDLVCPMCRSAKEDELHFVFLCPVLSDLRQQYIPLKYYRYPSLFRLVLLLSSRNELIIKNLATVSYTHLTLPTIYSV